jgi:hypothetical protein
MLRNLVIFHTYTIIYSYVCIYLRMLLFMETLMIQLIQYLKLSHPSKVSTCQWRGTCGRTVLATASLKYTYFNSKE